MTDDEVPPPYSEQELDQKIARALVISVHQDQEPPQDSADDGEWEQWDEAVFTAAEARRNRNDVVSSTVGSSASQTRTYDRRQSHNPSPLPVPDAVQPLRFHRKGSSSVSSGTSGSWMGVGSYGSSSSGHAVERRVRHVPPDSDDDDDRSIPPPPFASVGPRLDGISIMEYHPESTPPSPLNSPVFDHHLSIPPDPHLALTGQNHFSVNHLDPVRFSSQPGRVPSPSRQSLPIPPRSPNYHLQQRPGSTNYSHQNFASPHPVSNSPTYPSDTHHSGQRTASAHQPQSSPHAVYISTYKKRAQILPSQNQAFVASALYNSSVSGHLSTISMQPRESHSSRHFRSPQIAQPQPPQPHNTLHIAGHASSPALPLGAPSTNYLVNQTTPNIHVQGSFPPQHPTSATYFPQHPTYATQHVGDPTVPRWATSEQQLNQNFQR